MPSPYQLRILVLATGLLLAAGPAIAQTGSQQTGGQPQGRPAEPPLPTVEEILRRSAPDRGQLQQQQGRPAAPTAQIPTSLPTLGELAARAPAAAAAPGPTISCDPPERPTAPPDGKKASEDDMRKAEAVFRAYVDGGLKFQTCIDRAQREAFRNLSVAEFLGLEGLVLQMQASMEFEAERFNRELRSFRTR